MKWKKAFITLPLLFLLVFASCCSKVEKRAIEVTAYCGCGKCNSWERGSWKYLKLNFWNRYVNAGPRKGKKYTGLTAGGTKLRQYDPGFFSIHTVTHPWMIPVRILFFPWMFLPQKGTIAADTRYYAFGTKMYVPGYGWGIVEDRGGAIKGQNRLDIFFRSHGRANKWGRQNVVVEIHRKN